MIFFIYDVFLLFLFQAHATEKKANVGFIGAFLKEARLIYEAKQN